MSRDHPRVVVLAGGTGGAKLAAGMQEIRGDRLAVIANTGDDIEIHGVHVSPDPDLITYWLTDQIDADRGWGIRDDSFTTFERMVEFGAPEWFGLSDRDLAACLMRRQMLEEGATHTEAQARIATALGARAAVLPMSNLPVRTEVRTADGWREFQSFLIRDAAEPEIEEVRFSGIDAARPTPEVADAIESADAIIIGPSNPVISIGPILAVPGMRDLLSAASAPVVAVSPFVAGEVVKGPTEKFMQAAGHTADLGGLASAYEGLLDGLIADAADPATRPDGLVVANLDTMMGDRSARRAVAVDVLEFALSLGG